MTLLNPKFPRQCNKKNLCICQRCGKLYAKDPRGKGTKHCYPCRGIAKKEYEYNNYHARKKLREETTNA
jgi:hypothetical protein